MDSPQYVHVSLLLESPALDTAPRCVSPELWTERGSALLTCCNDLPDAARMAFGLLCHKGTLLAHGQFGVHQDSQPFSIMLLSSWLAPSMCRCMGFIPGYQVWHFHLLSFQESLSAYFSILIRSLGIVVQPSGVSTDSFHFFN